MDNQKFTFDKVIAVICLAAVIAFAIFHSQQVSQQMQTMNSPSALQFNYK